MKYIKTALRFLLLLFVLQGAAGTAPSVHAQWLSFDEMYAGASSQGLIMSDTLQSMNGQTVTMEGFMAPPLKPSINFFVLTEVPMSICPFCSSDADWPSNIVVVYLDDPFIALPYDQDITVTGRLEIGSYVDSETGFVSLVRIRNATVD
ncbi:MAG: hypothetical protein KHZ77_07025 [Veillonella sp.]|uniref:hypothetical protein n=1 Tax=Veillonella sp. TaxID=1926307 RepID=UPI002600EF1C|nr:hypothetical protein [Veillonella sp.]MBS4913904.1 hypothetical protein [Veillonella sp.]